MAIFKQFEVRVLVDGQPLSEHDDPANNYDQLVEKAEDAIVEKYIETTPGANFSVDLKMSPGFLFSQHLQCDCLSFQTSVDGHWINSPLMLLKDYRAQGNAYNEQVIGPVKSVDGINQVQKLRFQAINHGSNSNAEPTTPGNVKDLSTIKVEVWRRRCLARNTSASSNTPSIDKSGPSEKSLKGCANDTYTSLDTASKISLRQIWETETTHSKPLVTFIFHYYGREALQTIGILERPRSPTPLEEKDPTTLTPAQLLELVQKQKTIVQSQEDTATMLKNELRREKNLHNVRTVESLKRTRSPSPLAGDDELQEIKKSRKDRNITIVELD